MNILFINSISPSKFGGGEKWMVKAAQGLSQAGHHVFLASKKGAEILKAARRANIQTRIFNIHWDVSLLNTYRIVKFLKTENIQVLVCNLNKDVRVAGLAARLMKGPVVIARHGVLLCGKKWKHKVVMTRLVDGILTNTESIRQAYKTYGWFDEQFVEVIYNGIEDKSGIPPYDFQNDFPGKKIIFSAGRLSEQKGFTYLIRAAALLSKRRDDLVFVVAGKGRRKQSLKQLVVQLGLEDSFQFLGFIENIDPYLKGCDLFVLPSLFEGMPNVIMEAMAVGKAVVATDVNGVKELIEDGITGSIVPSRNIQALAETIDGLIDDRLRLAQFGEKGIRRVQKYFTIEKMVQNLERYFQQKIHRQ